jgi:hypothetical protein
LQLVCLRGDGTCLAEAVGNMATPEVVTNTLLRSLSAAKGQAPAVSAHPLPSHSHVLLPTEPVAVITLITCCDYSYYLLLLLILVENFLVSFCNYSYELL